MLLTQNGHWLIFDARPSVVAGAATPISVVVGPRGTARRASARYRVGEGPWVDLPTEQSDDGPEGHDGLHFRMELPPFAAGDTIELELAGHGARQRVPTKRRAAEGRVRIDVVDHQQAAPVAEPADALDAWPSLEDLVAGLPERPSGAFLRRLALLDVTSSVDVLAARAVPPAEGLLPVDRKIVDELAAHAALATLGLGAAGRTRLIQSGFGSPAIVAATAQADFVASIRDRVPATFAARIHTTATIQAGLVDSLLTAERVESVGRPAHDGSGTAEQDCGCTDCRAATSPMAYLADLLGYTGARMRVRSGGSDTRVGVDELAGLLQQPFGDLPVDCATSEDQLAQVRLCVEILHRLITSHLRAAPDVACSPLAHSSSFVFAADLDGDRRSELVIGFDHDPQSWISAGREPRSGVWVMRYDQRAGRWRHLPPGGDPTAAAFLLPPGVRARAGFGARFRQDSVALRADREQLVLVLDEPDQPTQRLWIMQYEPWATTPEEAWQHLNPEIFAAFGADYIAGTTAPVSGVFAADVDGDQLAELVLHGEAPPVAEGQPTRPNAFWVSRFDGRFWTQLGSGDVSFVCSAAPRGVRSTAHGDLDRDGREELVVVPAAPGRLGANPWVMDYDPVTDQWTHLCPGSGLPIDADAEVRVEEWRTSVALVGSFTALGSPELLVAADGADGADPSAFTVHRFEPGPPRFVPIGRGDCTAQDLPLEQAVLARIGDDLVDDLVITTSRADRSAAWVMDRGAGGGWAHRSPLPGHPLDADVEWTAAGRHAARSVLAADVDGDGYDELVFVGGDANRLWVLRYGHDDNTWRHLAPITSGPADGNYAARAYQALLAELGTSYGDLRAAAAADPTTRRALADRRGLYLDDTRPDALDTLLVPPGDVDQDVLERLFGLVSTMRDPLTAGPPRGPGSEQVHRWQLDHPVWSADSSTSACAPSGRAYLSFGRDAGANLIVATLWRDDVRRDPCAEGSAPPGNPIRLHGRSDSGVAGVVEIDFQRDTDGIELTVFPQVAVWRWQRLRALWDEEDWSADPFVPGVPGGARPVVDPDLIGPDDFRMPVIRTGAGPDRPFDLWVSRRRWLDENLAVLRARGTDMAALLATMRPPVPGQLGDFPWAGAPTDFDALAGTLTSGTPQEVRSTEAVVAQRLHLPVDAFLRLVELRRRDRADADLLATEWVEVRSILLLARKRARFPQWCDEETAADVALDTATFVTAPPVAREGAWPPEPRAADEVLGRRQPPLVEPELVAWTDLPVGLAGAEARALWHSRTGELVANPAAITGDWETMLTAALGPAPGLPWPEWVSDLAARLEDLDPAVVAAAAQEVRDAGLALSAFRRLAAANLVVARGADPTEGELADARRSLAQARKARLLYPVWTGQETAARRLPFWRARRLALTRWQGDPTHRQEWQIALAARTRPPVVDPDLVTVDLIRSTWSRAYRIRQDRLAALYQRQQAHLAAFSAAPDDLTGIDALLLEALWTQGERALLRSDLAARLGPLPRAAGAAQRVVAQELGSDAALLAGLFLELDAGGERATSARRTLLAGVGFTTVDAFREVMAVLDADPAGVVFGRWRAFEATLADLGMSRRLTRAEQTADESGVRLADLLSAVRLDPTAWRRLLAVRGLAVDGQPVLATEHEEVLAIARRAEKERLFGAWRLDEQAGDLPVRLGPDSFALPEELGADLPEPAPWRVRRAELTRWRATVRARLDQHRQVEAALAESVRKVEEATMPAYRDALLDAFPVPDTTPGSGARWVADHLLIDTSVDGCQRTTRVALAIDTLLALLWSVRSGQLSDTYPQLALEAPTFDQDWRWIGSYATWRSAILVHLYPENLLRPTLRRHQSPAFREALAQLRDGRRLSPARARRIAAGYADYLADVCHLDLGRLVCTRARSAYDTAMLERGTGGPRDSDLYFAISTTSKRVYHAFRDVSAVLVASGLATGFWHLLDQFGTGRIEDLVGAARYEPANDPARRRWLYLFAQSRDIEGLSLVFLRYDLDTAQWDSETTPLESPEGVTEFVAWIMRDSVQRPPRIGLQYETVQASARQTTRVRRSLNDKGTGWAREDFAPIGSVSLWRGLGTSDVSVLPRTLIAGDFDGDGRDEVAAFSRGAAVPRVLDHDGQGWTLLPPSPTPVPADAMVFGGRFVRGGADAIAWVPRIAAGQVVTARYDPATAMWTEGHGAVLPPFAPPRVAAAGDFDGDGVTELAFNSWFFLPVLNMVPSSFWLLADSGNGALGFDSRHLDVEAPDHRQPWERDALIAFRCSNSGALPAFAFTGDFDGDGRDEIAVALNAVALNALGIDLSRGNDLWVMDLRQRTGAWAPLGSVGNPDLHTVLDLSTEPVVLLTAVAGDVDGDGRDEIIAVPDVTQPGLGTSLFVADFLPGPGPDPAVGGSWGRLPNLDLVAQGSKAVRVVAGDFDGDGSDEVLILGERGEIWIRKFDLWTRSWIPFPGAQADFGLPVGAAEASAGRFVGPEPSDQLVLSWGWPGQVTLSTVSTARFESATLRPPPCTPPEQLAPRYDDEQGWRLDDTVDLTVRREQTRRALESNPVRPIVVHRYLWEAFYDLPLAIALELQAGHDYPKALDWFRLVYDYSQPPNAGRTFHGLVTDGYGTPERAEADPDDYTRRLLDWVRDPLDPHAIAAVRPHTYTRGTLLLLVRCLLDYADDEFTRDTSESITRARVLYGTARELLTSPVLDQRLDGCTDVVVRIPAATTDELRRSVALRLEALLATAPDQRRAATAAAEIAEVLDGVVDTSAAVRDAERLAIAALGGTRNGVRLTGALRIAEASRIDGQQRLLGRRAVIEPIVEAAAASPDSDAPGRFLRAPSPLFCVSPNPMVAASRMHTELNLHKIRTCRNISGLQRPLEPYSAPTDQTSGLPVIGADGQLVLPGNRAFAPTPYRYSALVEQARELAGQARDVEAMMLAALQNRDAEALNVLRARQEVRVARAGVRLQDLRVHQAEDRVELAKLQQQRAAFEVDHYQELLDGGENQYELEALSWLQTASTYQIAAAISSGVAAVAFGAAVPLSWNQPAAAANAAGSAAGAISASLSALAGNAGTQSQWNSLRSSFARTRQDWEFRRTVAGYDTQIAGAQVTVETDGVRIAEQERAISELQADHAEQLLDFHQEKFTNVELYDWMADILERTYRWFLNQATGVAQLAAQQLTFERQEGEPPAIRADYWEAPATGLGPLPDDTEGIDRRGLTGAVRLLRDIAALDQYAFDTNSRKLQLTQTFSLAQQAPLEFQRLRSDGVMTFSTPLEHYDRVFPGHHLRLIRRVTVSVMALVPPADGIRATLTSSGVSRVVVGPDVFQTVVLRRPPESVALTSPLGATGNFTFEQPGGLRDPFEGLGVDTPFEFRLPRPANAVDPRTLADVFVTIDYTALDSFDLRQLVVRNLDRATDGERGFTLRQDFADAWHDLHNPDQTDTPMQVAFSTTRADFPPNVDELAISHVAVALVAGEPLPAELSTVTLRFTEDGATARLGGAATLIERIVSTRRSNGGPWIPITGKVPIGRWELGLPDTDEAREWLAADRLDDVLLVIGYRATTPPWPE